MVTTRSVSWSEVVQKAWGKEYTAPTTAYEFTNRKFIDQALPLAGDGITAPAVVGDSLYADNYADLYA